MNIDCWRRLALIAILALAGCAGPVEKGPRNLNDALLERSEAR